MNGILQNMGRMMFNTFSKQLNHCGTPCNVVQCWKWEITQIINRKLQTDSNYAIIILNRPITQNQEFLTSLWNKAQVRVTVDAGTGRWHNFLNALPEETQKIMKHPDLITGDFDSISPEILEKYKKLCCKVKPIIVNLNVVHTPDQDHTDFTKALMTLHKHCQQQQLELDNVVVICQSSGRIDQILGNIQTLFLAKENVLLGPTTRLYLMSDDAVSWLLSPGDHIITIPENMRLHKRAWCSIVPVGETCVCISTTGLKWNLDNQPLQFGQLVSTSNTFDGSDHVTVKCSNTVLWSMKIPTS